jgi:ABC-type bacteriocin/lantibiotic exporter with double-glycine peptidase domain
MMGDARGQQKKARTWRTVTHLLFFILLILIVVVVVVVIVILLLVVIVIVIFISPPPLPSLLLLLVAVIFHVTCSLFFPLHTPLRELFHHFKELLTIVLQEVIGDCQDIARAYRSRDVNNRCIQTINEIRRKEKIK